jgi:hypothetical protein
MIDALSGEGKRDIKEDLVPAQVGIHYSSPATSLVHDPC